jgi:MoaA/NifB/PqqE/SkfB family radical SAM enzyme
VQGGFKDAIETLKRLKKSNVPVSAGMIIAKHNFNDVENVAKLCKESGVYFLDIYTQDIPQKEDSII